MVQILSDAILSTRGMQAGIRGVVARMNDRARNQGGFTSVNAVWSESLREYEIGFVPCLPEVRQEITALWEVTGAGRYGFLIEDPIDRHCTTADGVVAQDADDNWRLYKRYTAGSYSYDRTIRRPRATAVVYINGTPTACTLSTTTGIITWTGDPPEEEDVVTWSGKFLVPVQFADDRLPWEVVRSGNFDARLVQGPAVTLIEVREA